MSFRPAKLSPGGSTPKVLEKVTKASDTWPNGALLKVNTSGEFEECGADPTVVGAVSLSGNGNSLSYGTLRTDGFPPGYCQGALVVNKQPFLAKYVGTKGTPGSQYGVVVDSDGLWKVDFAETTTKVVNYESDPTAENLGLADEVLVTFIESVAQQL